MIFFGKPEGSAVLNMQGAWACSCHDLAAPAALPLRARCLGVGPCSICERACIRTVVAAGFPGLGKSLRLAQILAVQASDSSSHQ